MAIAFVFPGQGAQRVGMASDFLETDSPVRERFEEANDALGFDLAGIVFEGPSSRLMETEVTQPALLTVGVALWEVWRARGGAAPAVMAGHSLGEYTAFTAAGSMAFADAVRLVNARGRFMQEAVPVGEGAMAAILGLDDDAVSACCDQVDGVVQPANLNAPGQVVISGARAAVESAVAACSEAGARRAMMLDVSAPFTANSCAPQGIDSRRCSMPSSCGLRMCRLYTTSMRLCRRTRQRSGTSSCDRSTPRFDGPTA